MINFLNLKVFFYGRIEYQLEGYKLSYGRERDVYIFYQHDMHVLLGKLVHFVTREGQKLNINNLQGGPQNFHYKRLLCILAVCSRGECINVR